MRQDSVEWCTTRTWTTDGRQDRVRVRCVRWWRVGCERPRGGQRRRGRYLRFGRIDVLPQCGHAGARFMSFRTPPGELALMASSCSTQCQVESQLAALAAARQCRDEARRDEARAAAAVVAAAIAAAQLSQCAASARVCVPRALELIHLSLGRVHPSAVEARTLEASVDV